MQHPMTEFPRLSTLLERLLATDIEFILVGGLAAVVQGAPIASPEVAIVHRRTPENIERLLPFLASVNARYRGHPAPLLPPSHGVLLGPGHSLLLTELGPLDVLGAIDGGADYAQLLPSSTAITVNQRPLRLLTLEALVAQARASADAKARLRLPILEATLRRRQRR
jgi:hypothetical protein